MANNNDNNNEPMTDARLAEIRATLADDSGIGDIATRLKSDWMSIRFSAQVAQAALDLLAEVELDRSEVGRLRSVNWEQQKYIAALEAQLAAMREIVQAVAEADNSDSGVCYQLCNVRWYGGETWADEMEMRHDAPCIVTKARALLAPHERQA